MTIGGMSDTHDILVEESLQKEVDVLCIPGDFSPLRLQRAISHKEANGTMKQWIRKTFIPWLLQQPAHNIIVTPGNHDFVTECEWFPDWIKQTLHEEHADDRIHYLCNEIGTIAGVSFWGCPYSDLPNWAWYSKHDVNSYIPPTPVDVMLVHAAPQWESIGVTFTRFSGLNDFGSPVLTNALAIMPQLPKLLLCGHIHGGNHAPFVYGSPETGECLMLNVAIKDEDYMEHYHPAIINFNKTPDGMTTAINVERWLFGHLEDTNLSIIHTAPLKTKD